MEERQLTSIVRESGASRSVNLGPNKVTFLLSGADTGGTFSLTEFEAAAPPAPAAPIHIHRDADEAIYVLDGEFQVIIEGQPTAVHPGSSVFVPRGTPHNIANVGSTRGTILVMLTPPGFEGYWNEMAQLMQSSGGPVDPAVAVATQKKYHMDTQGQVRNFVDGR